ncbi:protein of unknown function (plasmid) [Pararobbsia alpina]
MVRLQDGDQPVARLYQYICWVPSELSKVDLHYAGETVRKHLQQVFERVGRRRTHTSIS